MSHKSLLVFASVLCWDEDFDEIMLAATLFIIYFCNKISISYLFHCMLPCVRTVQILFWMYFLCLYLKQWVVSQALQGSWNTKTKWGDSHYSAASATGTLNIQTDIFMNFFIHGNGQNSWKYYFHHIKNNWVLWAECWKYDWPVLQTELCWQRCATESRQC